MSKVQASSSFFFFLFLQSKEGTLTAPTALSSKQRASEGQQGASCLCCHLEKNELLEGE